jgi:hypothetical protein
MVVSEATIRQGVFSAISTLIIANKPTYTHNGTTYTYIVVAEYPDTDSMFPCIVINKANILMPTITMDAVTLDREIEVPMDFYAKETQGGKKAIDIAQDSIMNTMVGNIPTFIATDKLVPQEDFWQDSGSSVFEDKKQVLNTATSTVRFRLG